MRPVTCPDPLYDGWREESYLREGQFLNIAQVVKALEQWQAWRTPKMGQQYYAAEPKCPDMLQKYHDAHRFMPDLLRLYNDLPEKAFPVARLRHVTIADNFVRILESGKIWGSDRTFLLNGRETLLRVSCWGVHIPPKKLEVYQKKRFAQFMQLATERGLTWNLSPEASVAVRSMLANSPAMRECSRYGNFQFSFSTKDLLAMYRDQHCGGSKPVLRVLGTEAYKQELVHWILVHSPDCEGFTNLPTVDPPGPFSRDGNLMWTPESMTDQFTWEIEPYSGALEEKPMTVSRNQLMHKYNAWVWSNMVFAFYLPGGGALEISRQRLLENVQGCEAAGPPRHPSHCYMSKRGAQLLIEKEKKKVKASPRSPYRAAPNQRQTAPFAY